MMVKGKNERQDTAALDSLKEQVESLKDAMEKASRPYEEMSRKIDMLSAYADRYLKILGIIASHGTLSPALAVPDVKDSIEKDIITILAEKSPLNISQITEALRERRGSASRRIVREKIKELIDMGHIIIVRDKIPGYSLSEDVVRKWSQMLTGLK
jgi:DNA-binding transcriptional ArsR family regulator